MDLSVFGKATAPSHNRVPGEAFAPQGVIRAGDSHLPHTTEYAFIVTYNSGNQQRVIIRAISAHAAIGVLRRDCCGLVRFQLCAQRGTCYPY